MASPAGLRAFGAPKALACFVIYSALGCIVAARCAATGTAFQPVFEGEAELAARLIGGELLLEPAGRAAENTQAEMRRVEALNLDKNKR